MRKALTVLFAAATLTACGSDTSTDEPASETTTEQQEISTGPGDPAVYERIQAATDCAVLQQEFDTASANNERAQAGSDQAEVTLAYMKAADDRLQELDCY